MKELLYVTRPDNIKGTFTVKIKLSACSNNEAARKESIWSE
jgi:hypothetical protein